MSVPGLGLVNMTKNVTKNVSEVGSETNEHLNGKNGPPYTERTK